MNKLSILASGRATLVVCIILIFYLFLISTYIDTSDSGGYSDSSPSD